MKAKEENLMHINYWFSLMITQNVYLS